MLNHKVLWRIGLAVIIVVFAFGVTHLFKLRFQAGDIYPPYSSLRSDPLGTLAFYESLSRIAAVETQRLYKPFNPKDLVHSRTTLLYLGLTPKDAPAMNKAFIKPLNQLAARGGRVVVTFVPISEAPSETPAAPNTTGPEPSTGADTTDDDDDSRPPDEAAPSALPPVKDDPGVVRDENDGTPADCCDPQPVQTLWSVDFGYLKDTPEQAWAVSHPTLASSHGLTAVPWHSVLYFSSLSPLWKTLYTFADRPVIIERPLGKGTLVLCADSYFLSNEALRNEPHPGLLSWLVGSSHQIVFDEFHHGVARHPGVVTLIRNYHLYWVVLGFAVLAALFVWQRATPFMAPLMQTESHADIDIHKAKDDTQGLISLLRRNVPENDLLTVCVNEWRATPYIKNRLRSNAHRHLKQRIDAVLSASSDRFDPVGRYHEIRKIAVEKKPK